MSEQSERMENTSPCTCCELTPVELVDAVYEMVFACKPESPAQEEWKRRWLINAKRHGAGFDC
jgi:hypothetical protein